MPQTSLSAWLNRPTGLQPPPPAKVASNPKPVDKREPKRLPPQALEALPLPQDANGNTVPSAEPSSAPDSKALPPNVELRACRKEDISHLKRLNSLLLPIPYPDKFYREIVEDPLTNNITLVAVWHDEPREARIEKGRLIGAIRCRILAHPHAAPGVPPKKSEAPILYLSTVVLLSPYRSYGIASAMLDVLTRRAVEDYGVRSVGAHVWKANGDGLEWYRKRGFRMVGEEEGYYGRLQPSTAVVMQKNISMMDHLAG